MIQELDAYFVQDPAIHAAYLFGSFARNRQRPGSDVDIAVLLDERGERKDRGGLLGCLHRDLGRLLRKDIHVLVLNDASLLARIEAVFKGRCVHVKDEEALVQFKMLTISLFADFAPYLDQLNRRLKKRLGVSSNGE
jgi:predicted nucleotidyltransferase